MKSFSDKVIAYMGSQFIDSILQIVASMLLVRYLSKYDYGTYRQIMLISVLLSTTIAVGLPQSLSYFIPRASSLRQKKQLACQIFIFMTLLGVLASLLCYLLRFQISRGFNNPELARYAWVYSLFFLFLLPSKCTQPTLVALGKTNLASLINFASAVFNFVFVIIPLLRGQDIGSILTYLLAFFIVKFIIVVLVLTTLKGGGIKLVDIRSIKAQLLYGLPLGGALILGVIRKYLDQFIIGAFYNPVNFAIYSRGAFELPLVNLLPYTLSTLMVPRIAGYWAEGQIASIMYLWHEAMRKVALVLFPVFVFSFLFAEEIITLLFTRNYIDSVSVFRIYLLLLPTRIIAYRTVLQAIGQTRPILKATIISLITGAVCGVAFERVFGLMGPAMGTVLALLVAPGYLLVQTKKHLGVKITDLFSAKNLAAPMFFSILSGGAVFPLVFLDLGAFWTLAVSGTAFSLIYVFMMKSLKIFTTAEWDLICRWITLKALFNR